MTMPGIARNDSNLAILAGCQANGRLECRRPRAGRFQGLDGPYQKL